MASSQLTPYLGLSNFSDTDKPTFRGDWNNDNSKIDVNAKKVAEQLNSLGSRTENINSTLSQSISGEAAARQSADSELNRAVEAETARALSAEKQNSDLIVEKETNLSQRITEARAIADDINTEIASYMSAGEASELTPQVFRRFLICAQNAACGFAENSLEGISYCRDNNMIPQVDVMLLRDGTPVLHADDNLGRTEYNPQDLTALSEPVGSVANLTEWHKYKQYPYTPGGRSSFNISLEECLKILGRKLIIINLADSSEACYSRVIALIERYHMQPYVFLCMSHITNRTAEDIKRYRILQKISNNDNLDDAKAQAKKLQPFGYVISTNFGLYSTRNQLDSAVKDVTKTLPVIFCNMRSQKEYRAARAVPECVGVISYRPDYITNQVPKTGKILGDGRGAVLRPHEHNNTELTWDPSEAQGLFLAGNSFGFRGAYSDNKWNAVIEPYELRDLTLTNGGHIDFSICGHISESARTENWDDDFIKIVAWMDGTADSRFKDASPDYDKLIWHATRDGRFGLWGGIGKPIQVTEYISTVNGSPASQSNPNKTPQMGWGFNLSVSFTESEMAFTYNDDHISAFQSGINFSPHLLSNHVNFAIVMNAACRLTVLTANYNYLPGGHGSPGRVNL